ncbi:ribokinase [Shimazuella alba]|uniref:Ribokinase n=1 Tax=Shimazuella alba TaxID=2690964 RepID=A0A6I4VZ58_9BACL|nr:ribokinase [Shimazuella alba]MXQ55036.1 ribokinase [Shimazuella alba]
MSKILLIGSINMDLVVVATRRAHPGETIFGEQFHIIPGGKGANQAVAAARLGADVHLVGAVGNDQLGKQAFTNLQAEGVNTNHIQVLSDVSTGTAHITVAEGDNTIIVVPAANEKVSPNQVDSVRSLIQDSDIVLLQLEIPIETIEYIVDLCTEFHVPVILNPAPAQKLPLALLEKVTYLTPNEHEVKILFPHETIEQLLKRYPKKLLVTEGVEGVRYDDGENLIHVPAVKVKATDTTGAGDTFNGALAVGLSRGMELKEAICFANLAAGISVTKLGAQGGMPTLEQLHQLQGEINEKSWND